MVTRTDPESHFLDPRCPVHLLPRPMNCQNSPHFIGSLQPESARSFFSCVLSDIRHFVRQRKFFVSAAVALEIWIFGKDFEWYKNKTVYLLKLG